MEFQFELGRGRVNSISAVRCWWISCPWYGHTIQLLCHGSRHESMQAICCRDNSNDECTHVRLPKRHTSSYFFAVPVGVAKDECARFRNDADWLARTKTGGELSGMIWSPGEQSRPWRQELSINTKGLGIWLIAIWICYYVEVAIQGTSAGN